MKNHHGKQLAIRIKLSGITQSKIAQKVGKTAQAVSLDIKKEILKDEVIANYGAVIGFSIDDFLNEKELIKSISDNDENKLLELKLAAAERENEHLREKMRLQEEIYRLTLEKLRATEPNHHNN